MNCCELEYLETLTGARWTGMRFCDRSSAVIQRCATLCQAIDRSFSHSFSLPAEGIECPGALRCLGFRVDDEQMAAHIAHEAGANIDSIRAIIAGAPRLEQAVPAVDLGHIAAADLCAGYLRPDAAMKLLRHWQVLSGAGLSTQLSSFMAICSAIVDAHKKNALVFSMGCPESRIKGGIAPDRLVAVLPRAMVDEMMKEDSVCRRMHTNAPPAGSGLNNSKK